MQGIRHHKENFFHTRFWIVVLVILCILGILSAFNMFKKYRHAKTIRNDYQAELQQVHASQATLEKNIESLSTERGKEAEIRDRYRVVKEGEQMILIVDNIEAVAENTQESSKIGLWQRIISIFR